MGNPIMVPDQVRASFTGELVGPSDPGYDQVRRVHNGLIDKRPGLIARCRTVPDIVDAVAIGKAAKTIDGNPQAPLHGPPHPVAERRLSRRTPCRPQHPREYRCLGRDVQAGLHGTFGTVQDGCALLPCEAVVDETAPEESSR